MQVITALLVLLSFAEAGLIKAPRTASASASASAQIASGAHTVTPCAMSPTTPVVVSPTVPTAADTAQARTTSTDLPYGFVAIVQSMEGPEPTAAPALENGGGERTIVADGRKFVQTTYWACETFPKETHCGWHEPILDVSTGASLGGGSSALRAGFAATCVVAIVAYMF